MGHAATVQLPEMGRGGRLGSDESVQIAVGCGQVSASFCDHVGSEPFSTVPFLEQA